MSSNEEIHSKRPEDTPSTSGSDKIENRLSSASPSKVSSPVKIVSPKAHFPGLSYWRSASWKVPEVNFDRESFNASFKNSGILIEAEKATWVPQNIRDKFEEAYIYFLKYFVDKSHLTYIAHDSIIGPIIFSLAFDGIYYRGILRTERGPERFVVSAESVEVPWIRKIFGLGPPWSTIMKAMSPTIPLKQLKLCKDVNAPKRVLATDERLVVRHFKFGILYILEGQVKEEEMLDNTHESASDLYKKFLEFMGSKIELKNWKYFRGGLDVKNDTTGVSSYYTRFRTYEIMFHVSTLLPLVKSDPLKLERKRQIGNDIVLIVFCDKEPNFTIDTIASLENQVYFVVVPSGDRHYKIQILTKPGVEIDFLKDIKTPLYLSKDASSREFLIYKLISAERAAYQSPDFAPKLRRTTRLMLQNLAESFGFWQ